VFLDLSQFEVDGDGQVDEDEVAEAIETLLTERPYLAVAATVKQPRFQAAGPRRPQGDCRSEAAHRAGREETNARAVDEAHRKGQLRDYLGG